MSMDGAEFRRVRLLDRLLYPGAEPLYNVPIADFYNTDNTRKVVVSASDLSLYRVQKCTCETKIYVSRGIVAQTERLKQRRAVAFIETLPECCQQVILALCTEGERTGRTHRDIHYHAAIRWHDRIKVEVARTTLEENGQLRRLPKLLDPELDDRLVDATRQVIEAMHVPTHRFESKRDIHVYSQIAGNGYRHEREEHAQRMARYYGHLSLVHGTNDQGPTARDLKVWLTIVLWYLTKSVVVLLQAALVTRYVHEKDFFYNTVLIIPAVATAIWSYLDTVSLVIIGRLGSFTCMEIARILSWSGLNLASEEGTSYLLGTGRRKGRQPVGRPVGSLRIGDLVDSLEYKLKISSLYGLCIDHKHWGLKRLTYIAGFYHTEPVEGTAGVLTDVDRALPMEEENHQVTDSLRDYVVK